MDRRDFLVSIFAPVKDIFTSLWAIVKRVAVPVAVLLVGLYLYNSDFKINWPAIVEFFTLIITTYWMYIAAVLVILIGLSMIRRRLSPEGLKRFNKILNIILTTVMAAVLLWIVYDYYTKGQYGQIISMVVLFAVLKLFNYNDEKKDPA